MAGRHQGHIPVYTQGKAPDCRFRLAQADKHHIFAAVISCIPTAQGGRYLQRHIQRELQGQLRQHGGNVQAALPAALRALNQAFRDMHPFNGSVFEGVKMTLAYVDAKTKVGIHCPLHRSLMCHSGFAVYACVFHIALSLCKCFHEGHAECELLGADASCSFKRRLSPGDWAAPVGRWHACSAGPRAT